ncbi:MAG: EMC3/TMCO1 family protein [Candidatus Micrarchaeota archaeon]
MFIGNDALEIFILAFVMSIISNYLSNRFGGQKRLKEIQAEVNAWQKELKEANDKKDEAKTKKLMEREDEMMKKIQEMAFLPFRTMIVVLPVFLFALYVVIPAWYPKFIWTNMPFSVPSSIAFWEPWKNYLGGRGMLIYSALVSGLLIQALAPRVEGWIKKARGQ